MPLISIGALPTFSAAIELLWRLVPNLSTHAATQVVTGLWQGMAITLALAMVLRIAPRLNASLRFVAWSAAFVTILLLPFIGYLSNFFSAAFIPATSVTVLSSGPAGAPFHITPLQVDFHWSFALAALWLAATLTRATLLASDFLRLRRVWRSATPLRVETSYPGLLELPGRRTLQICSTTELERPAVIGFHAPRILIPAWLLDGPSDRLTTHELDQVILHETEHLRRFDDWTNLFQKLALIFFPLNPALLYIDRRLGREREMASDEGVIRITHAPRAYAACLAGLAERGVQHRAQLVAPPTSALVLGAWRRRSELLDRVQSILARRPNLHPALATALVPVVGLTLLGASVELSRCPQLVAFVPAANPAAFNTASPSVAKGSVSQQVVQPAVPIARQVNLSFPEPAFGGHTRGGSQVMRRLATSSHTRPSYSAQPVSLTQVEGSTPYLPVDFRHQPAGKPGQAALSAQAPQETSSPATGPATQGWLILTTWEQVTGDLDLPGLRAQQVSNVTRTRVTELLFQVSRRESNQTSAAPTVDAPAPQPWQTPTPPRFAPATALIPTRDGWVVIQL